MNQTKEVGEVTLDLKLPKYLENRLKKIAERYNLSLQDLIADLLSEQVYKIMRDH